MELHFVKCAGGILRPANQADADAVNDMRNGAMVVGEFRQPRNPKFHRKFFALLNFGYDYWDPPVVEYNGIKSEKSLERFRNEVTVLAGWYTVTTDLKGNVRLEPRSISFAKMDDIEFNNLYKAVFNVIWSYVLSRVQGMTPELVENTINQLVSFDG